MTAKRSKSQATRKHRQTSSKSGDPRLRVAKSEQLRAPAQANHADPRLQLELLNRRFENFYRILPGAFFEAQCTSDLSIVRVDFVSAGLEECFGLNPQAVVDNPSLAWDLVHADDRDWLVAALREGLAKGRSEFECRIVLPGYGDVKRTRWIRLLVIPTQSDGGAQPCALSGIVEDITERKAIEESVWASERQLRQLAENINEMFWVSEINPRKILYVSPTYENIWGRSSESLYENANSFLEGIHPDDRPRIEESLPKARLGGYDQVYRVVHHDGSVRTVRARAFPVRNEAGEVYRIAGIVEDITKSKQAEEELQAKQRFLEHLLQVQEGERKLVAYDIHDGFVQSVIAAVMHLEGLGVDPHVLEATREKLTVPLKLLRDSIEEARRMISGLRPPIIDEQGLVAAIEYLINEAPAQATLVTFTHSMNFPRLDGVREGALFRVVQEALSNALRHSQARTAQVTLIYEGDHVSLIVEDSGIGFDLRRIKMRQFGLRGIHERARLFGGRAAIRSAPGEGTRISVELPLRSQLGDSSGA